MRACEGCGASVEVDEIGEVTLHLSHAKIGDVSAVKHLCADCGAIIAQIFVEVGKVSRLSTQLDDFLRQHAGEPEAPKC